jgi:peptidoglycan/xylan/chitin deacetylase (PgdA/CDA1 family)
MSYFVISLDFELYWGVRDSRGREYFKILENVHIVIPKLLDLFERYDVACTWATVGAVHAKDYHEFIKYQPKKLPSYKQKSLSPFNDLGYLSSIESKVLFAPMIVKTIIRSKKQEIASHTFSHYYALEEGQVGEEFKSDLKACSEIARKENIFLKSLVFPRNQFNVEYLSICKDVGYSSYRGNPEHWAYQAESRKQRSTIKRAFRLLDSYIPLSGSLRQQIIVDDASGLVNVPASLFLRPWSQRLSILEPLRLWRIKWSMTRTAKKGGLFHLWWHPHNFGMNMAENLIFLEEILKHYQMLNKKYSFQSLSMADVALKIEDVRGDAK